MRKSVLFWFVFSAILFSTGVAAGIFIPAVQKAAQQSISVAAQTVNTVGQLPSGVQEPAMLVGIFVKNMAVVFLVLLGGQKTLGLLPATVCLENGAAMGVIGKMLVVNGIPPAAVVAGFAVHGVIELPAVFLACGYAMKAAWSKKKLPFRERMGALRVVAPMLAVAAFIETFVTPEVLSRMVS